MTAFQTIAAVQGHRERSSSIAFKNKFKIEKEISPCHMATIYDIITKSDYNLKTKEVQTNTYNKPVTWDGT